MKTTLYFLIFVSIFQCKRQSSVIDVNDCDTIGNYYEGKEHFIKREFVTDEGVIDYKKLLQKYKGKETVCNPLKD